MFGLTRKEERKITAVDLKQINELFVQCVYELYQK